MPPKLERSGVSSCVLDSTLPCTYPSMPFSSSFCSMSSRGNQTGRRHMFGTVGCRVQQKSALLAPRHPSLHSSSSTLRFSVLAYPQPAGFSPPRPSLHGRSCSVSVVQPPERFTILQGSTNTISLTLNSILYQRSTDYHQRSILLRSMGICHHFSTTPTPTPLFRIHPSIEKAWCAFIRVARWSPLLYHINKTLLPLNCAL